MTTPDHEHLSLDGRRYVVRACTEKPGLWIEVYNAPDSFPRLPDELDKAAEGAILRVVAQLPFDKQVEAVREMRHDHDVREGGEPYSYFFIPAEIRHAVADSLRATDHDILEDDEDDHA